MSLAALVVLGIPMLIVAVLVRISSEGPVLYWSDRVGKNNTIFKMPKFRTMRINTPAVATHLLGDPDRFLTSIGKFLRKSSLDELPQLLSILKGDMSIVGPRPALFNQEDLISLRTENGVHVLL
ncbi:MAG: sugar transferase, partial [Desulfobulbaceae bacterium]|nr:sugar transferase [Desulfobulbaceae bacterium]